MKTAARPVAIVHVAGPVELAQFERPDGTVGQRDEQRCLRCDVVLATRPGVVYGVGTRLALAPGGRRMKRYAVGGRALRDGEVACAPTPFLDL